MSKYSNSTYRPIKKNRFYICRLNPPTVIIDQPLLGFRNKEVGEAYLAGKFYNKIHELNKFKIIQGEKIAGCR